LSAAGFRAIRLVTVEGPFCAMPDLVARMADPCIAATVLRLLDRIEAEKTLLGVGFHFLACAGK
jgi:hypothetical protein